MSKVLEAVERFKTGDNCAQSILGTYGPDYNLSQDECLRISSGFGGGMRRGEVCGAVSGAVMVLGLNFDPGDISPTSREAVNADTLNFTNRFESECGSLRCMDLLGCDISTPEGRLAAKVKNTSETVCPHLVQTAAVLLEELNRRDHDLGNSSAD